jgi:hypothetical protein
MNNAGVRRKKIKMEYLANPRDSKVSKCKCDLMAWPYMEVKKYTQLHRQLQNLS